MSKEKASELTGLAGVEQGRKASLLRLTEFFPNGNLREVKDRAIDTNRQLPYTWPAMAILWPYPHIGACDVLVTFNDACPTFTYVRTYVQSNLYLN